MAGLYDRAPWLADPVFGSELVVSDLLIAGGVLLFGIVTAFWYPGMMARQISRIFMNIELKRIKKQKKHQMTDDERENIERRSRRTVEIPLKRGLITIYLLIFFILSFLTLGIDMSTRLVMANQEFRAYQFVQWITIFTFFLLFSLFAAYPLLRAIVYAVFSQRLRNSEKYALYRSLKIATRLFLIVLGSYLAILYSFPLDQMVTYRASIVLNIHIFLLIILLSYISAKYISNIMGNSVKRRDRLEGGQKRSLSRLIQAGIYLLGGLIALLVIGLDPLTMGTLLGLIGFALAFGLQDTVANFAAGIMIAMDKPFVIGDRIRLDWGGREAWGDVTDISLRSTWIKTPEDEMIVIPNMLIASQQLWNYTRDSPDAAMLLNIQISYESDWRLAERSILEILKSHPFVLSHPPPTVLMTGFEENGVNLRTRFWVADARDKLAIGSDVLKKVKDAFDRERVEIPYPHRIMIRSEDHPKPGTSDEEYISPLHLPSTGWKKMVLKEDRVKLDMGSEEGNILSPTSGPYPAKITAPYVMGLARKMNAAVTVLFIKTPKGQVEEGKKALRIYNRIAKIYNVEVKLIYEEGDVLEKILSVAETEGATLAVMGSTEESLFSSMTRRSITSELLSHLNIPTLVVPFKGEAKRMYSDLKKMNLLAPGDDVIMPEDEEDQLDPLEAAGVLNTGP
ncbi:MAG: mechanosensitive ion channel [Thermoplasmata archaeon]|nr:mechanosensitive ion channel [Thermoplasmata archaeon]